MTVRLRFFASLRERLRMSECERDLPEGTTVRQVWDALCTEHTGLKRLAGSISYAVNRDYASLDTALHDGDELAFIPPVSGG